MDNNKPISILASLKIDETSIENTIDSIQKQLKNVEVKVELDQKSLEKIKELSKLDLNNLNAQKLTETTTQAISKAKEYNTEINKITDSISKAGFNFKADGVYKDLEQIKKSFDGLDATFKSSTAITDKGQELTSFSAILKSEGKQIEQVYKLITQENKKAGDVVGEWKLDSIKELDAVLTKSAQESAKFSERLTDLHSKGKLTTEQFKSFSEALTSVGNTQQGLKGLKTELDMVSSETGKANTALEKMKHEINMLGITEKITTEQTKQLHTELMKVGTSTDGVNKMREAMALAKKETAEAAQKQKEHAKESEDLRKKLVQLEHAQNSYNEILARYPKSRSMPEAAELAQVIRETKNATLSSRDLGIEIDKIKVKTADLKNSVVSVSRSSMTLMDSFRTAMEKFPVWMGASTIFYGVTRTARDFMTTIIEVDTKMTELRKVMSDSTDFSKVFDDAAESAERFGTTIRDALDSAAEFARQGFVDEELKKLNDAAMVMGNVGDITAEKAADFMTATLLQWEKDATDAMGIVDAWNEISNNYATTTTKLAEGQARAGATARSMGLDFNQLNAVIGTVTATTKQSGSEVGNFVKFILPRLIGEPAQKALASLNVELVDQQGNLRDVMQVYTEVAQKIKGVNDEQKIAVVEGLAGKHHISRLQSLLDDLGKADSLYRSMYDSSVRSAGSAMQENEEYMKSMQARINKSKVEIEKLALALGDAFATETMIGLIEVFGDFIKITTKAVDTVGALPIALGLTASGFFAMSDKTRLLTERMIDWGVSKTQAIKNLGATTVAVEQTANSMGKAEKQAGALGLSLKSLAGFAALNLAFMAVGFAAEAMSKKIAEVRERQENLALAQRVSVESMTENGSQIESLASKYQQLQDALKSTTLSEEDRASKTSNLQDITNQLAQLMPTLKTGEDEYGNAILVSNGVIRTRIDLTKDAIATESELAKVRKEAELAIDVTGVQEQIVLSNKSIKQSISDIGQATKEHSGIWENFFSPSKGQDVEYLRERIARLNEMQDEYIQKGGQITEDSPFVKVREEISNIITELSEQQALTQSLLEAQLAVVENIFMSSGLTLTQSIKDMFSLFTSELINALGLTSAEADLVMSSIIANLKTDEALQVMVSNFSKAMESLETAKQRLAAGEISTAEFKKFENEANTAMDSVIKKIEELEKSGQIDLQGLNAKDLIGILEDSGQAIVNLGVGLDNLDNTSRSTGISIDEASNSITMLGDEAENAEGSVDSLTDSMYGMNLFSEEGNKVLDELVGSLEVYSLMLDNATEGTEMYDLAQQNLTIAKDELLSRFPDLFASYDFANLSVQDMIAIIKEEQEAQEILAEVLGLVANGHVSDEDRKKVATVTQSNIRIAQIDTEIAKLKELANTMNEIIQVARENNAVDDWMAHDPNYNPKGNQMLQDRLKKEREELIKGRNETLKNLQSIYSNTNATKSNSNAKKGNTAAKKANTGAKKANTAAKKAGTAATKKSTTATQKATKEIDKYKAAIEALTLSITKQQMIQKNFPDYSKEWRQSKTKEIELEKDKLAILQKQSKELGAQISSGEIYRKAVVTTTEQIVTQSAATSNTVAKQMKLSGWGTSVSSKFGYRKHPVTGQLGSKHTGVDLPSKMGTRLDSNVDGTVISAGYNSISGNFIEIKDKNGVVHRYGHLSSIGVKKGQAVSAGNAIGKIGSTGRSTGPHLHYETKVNGVAVDPIKYALAAQRGQVLVQAGQAGKTSTSTVTKTDTSGAAAAVADAKSDLVKLQEEIIKQEQAIIEMQREILESFSREINVAREKEQRVIDYETEKIKGLDLTSDRYRKTLSLQSSHLRNKQSLNLEELDYLQRMIDSGQLTAVVAEEMRIRMQELQIEILATTNALKDFTDLHIESHMKRWTEHVERFALSFRLLESRRGTMEEGTKEYISLTEEMISALKREKIEMENQRKELQRLIKTGGQHFENIKKHKKEIDELAISIWQLEGNIIDLEKSMIESQEAKVGELADKLIEAYKKYLSEKKDMHLEDIQMTKDAEDKRHKQVMDNYSKELDMWRKLVNEKLQEIDRTESERNYNKEINELEEQRIKVIEKINRLSLDDSFEAKADKKRLEEELENITKNIEDKRHQREIELRKESLNDTLKAKEEEIKGKEEKETEYHEGVIDKIDKEYKYWEKYYNDRLNDEREFARMRQAIIDKQFDKLSKDFQSFIKEMEDTMPRLEDTLGGTMEAVGTAIRKNIVDELREALRLLQKFQTDSSKVEGTYDKDGNLIGQIGGGASEDRRLTMGDLQVLAGKYAVDVLTKSTDNAVRKQSISDKGHDIAKKGRVDGSTISSDIGYQEAIKNLTAEQLVQLGDFLRTNFKNQFITEEIKQLIDAAGLQLIAANKDLADKDYEFNKGLEPNKYINQAFAGKEQIVINPEWIKYQQSQGKKIEDLLGTPKTEDTVSPVSITFEVDKMIANESTAKDFARELDDDLKRLMGVR